MRPKDLVRAEEFDRRLRAFALGNHPLPGVASVQSRATFIEQLLESLHRIEYIARIRNQELSDARMDATSGLFDPLKAVLLHPCLSG